ncbi:exonuclease SbcCD subunit D [Amycolatopsis suaedae]|uniref:Nuclease SbcCD subunit D n=1 Tax=Amycolatopsis suaedae TaxID=2510978 RepID=A0A4Q7JBE3_9PSEU|nr:exonuclease SbcCD subunit D [Amycolatopsis suaedae]RZQ63574.1 exonuclease SbcCD subunit D [Amycolatopsis suaedae]
MRVLHTSDWHIGRSFHGADLLAEQETVLNHLAELVAGEAVDVVLVSGDVYDRAVPSAEAVEVATRGLEAIRAAGAQLVITSGNHDSAPRLGALAGFAAAGGLHLRTTIDSLHRPALFTDEHGPVAVYGIPYLEPEPARHALGIEARGHTGVLTEAMRRITEDLATRPEGTRSIVLAHAFVTGGVGSDSERPIAVGGVEQVGGAVFDGVDYVALGHLHGPQTLAEHLRYSGSPLAYSFTEATQRKSVWLVDLDAGGLAEVRRRELPVPRPLSTVTGKLDDLVEDPELETLVEHYLSVTLTDDVRPLDAMRKLRNRFPYAVHLDWQPESGRAVAELRYSTAVRGRSDIEISSGFLADCRGAGPNESEKELLGAAFEAASRVEPPG